MKVNWLQEARPNLPFAEFQPRFVLISKELPVKEFELLNGMQDQSRLIPCVLEKKKIKPKMSFIMPSRFCDMLLNRQWDTVREYLHLSTL